MCCTRRDVNEEKEKQLTDLRVLTESLQQQTSTAEVRAQEASAAAELAQEEIVRRRDEGEALHARVQHLEREANDLANRMRVRHFFLCFPVPAAHAGYAFSLYFIISLSHRHLSLIMC